MSISRVNAYSAQANNVSITNPSPGDLIVVFAHRDGSTTAPTVPSNYQEIAHGGANTNSAAIGYRISDGTETGSGTWTNATSIAVGVYRGCDPNTPIGGWAVGGASSGTMSYTGLTMFRTDNTSWVVGVGASRNATNVGTNAPSGMFTQSSATDVAIFDTNGTVTSWSTQTASTNGTTGYRTYTIELMSRRNVTWSDPLIQQVSALAQVENGNAFKCLYPNATLNNNLLVMCLSWTQGISITSVQDDTTTNWTSGASVNGNGTTGLTNSAIYYRAGAPAGILKVTVTFASSVANFEFVMSEYYGIATSSPVDGTATSATVVPPLIQSGSITTANDGSLILQYVRDAFKDDWTTFPDLCTGMSPDTGFAMTAASRLNHYGLQYGIQTTHGAINPQMCMKFFQSGSGDITDTDTQSLSIAFTRDGSGTPMPGGIRIVRIHAENMNTTNASGTGAVQFPCVGNLLVAPGTTWGDISGIWPGNKDTQGNSWVPTVINSGSPVGFYAPNPITARDLLIFPTWSSGGASRPWMRFIDIVGADTVSPFDKTVNGQFTQSSAGQDVPNTPQITPSTPNGLIIAFGGESTGPSSGMYSPTGGYYENHVYTGETDIGWMNNGDTGGHYYNPDTSQVSFSWHMSNPSATAVTISAMAFKCPQETSPSPQSDSAQTSVQQQIIIGFAQ